MADTVLTYPLVDGCIHNWLVLGPCDTVEAPSTNPLDAPLPNPEFTIPAELDRFPWQGRTLFWITALCEADHLLDWSGFVPVYTHRRAWAFAQLIAPDERRVTMQLAALSSLVLWHNGEPILQTRAVDEAAQQQIHRSQVELTLAKGVNNFLVRVDQQGAGDLALALGLAIVAGEIADLVVQLPTVPHNVALRQKLERAFANTHLDRAVYSSDQPVQLIADAPTEGAPSEVLLRLQSPSGAIFTESTGKLSPGDPVIGVRGAHLPSGAMHGVLMPPMGEFYDRKLRARRILPFWVTRPTKRKPSTADERLVEVIQAAARQKDLFAEIAKMALGEWNQVKPASIQEAVKRVHDRHVNCLPDLLGLMGMVIRFGAYADFPAALLPVIKQVIRDFGMSELPATLDMSESDQLLLFSAWVLGKQIDAAAYSALPPGIKANPETTSIDFLVAWLGERGQNGFADIHSRLDRYVLALSYLVDLAEATILRELAAVILDRLLYDLAIHSIYGVYAPARGSVESAWLRSGRFTPESGLSNLLWGMGSNDGDLRSVLSLSLAGRQYQMPEVIRSIALDRPESMWAQERRRAQNEHGQEAVVHVAYKTPHFLLASLQDYHPGQRGKREQVWQATFGPEALIFTNHATTFSQSDSRHAAWWVGNGALPRVYQWHDALVALYHVPEEIGLDFTHAYFPTYAFDEYTFAGGWAFARSGDGYVALWAARGFEFINRGQDAYRELRSSGRRNVWLCQMGRTELDGTFEEFQKRVMAQTPDAVEDSVDWQTIRGDRLQVAWTGPILRNERPEDWGVLPHHHSPYAHAELPATHMDIGIGSEIMRLDFKY